MAAFSPSKSVVPNIQKDMPSLARLYLYLWVWPIGVKRWDWDLAIQETFLNAIALTRFSYVETVQQMAGILSS